MSRFCGLCFFLVFFFSSRRRHTRCALVTGVQTCALPICPESFLAIGSWIGGDRDGNPYVTAEALSLALTQQARAVLEFYLEQIHALGAELSIDRKSVV